MTYSPVESKEISKRLAEEIKREVQTSYELKRYKLICLVNIGEMNIVRRRSKLNFQNIRALYRRSKYCDTHSKAGKTFIIRNLVKFTLYRVSQKNGNRTLACYRPFNI